MGPVVMPQARFVIFCSAILVAVGASPAAGQRALVQGIVSDSAGQPVKGADVSLNAHSQLSRTDDRGRFSFRRVPLGPVTMRVRHLGYTPAAQEIDVPREGLHSVTIVRTPQPGVLAVIEVSATERQRRTWIEEFYRRRTRGIGTFVTREEILSRNSSRPSDMFRTTPGVRVVKGRGVRFNYSTSMDARRDCPPLLWLDGQRAPGLELDDLPLTDIEGIELYGGPSTTPAQFSQSLSGGITCGTIVVWTRPPDSRSP
jgi:hypothetical protein